MKRFFYRLPRRGVEGRAQRVARRSEFGYAVTVTVIGFAIMATANYIPKPLELLSALGGVLIGLGIAIAGYNASFKDAIAFDQERAGSDVDKVPAPIEADALLGQEPRSR